MNPATGALPGRARGHAEWPPVGGAFAASVAIHALAIAGAGVILARAPAAATPSPFALPIQAVLVEPKAPSPPPLQAPVPVRTAQASSPAPPVREAPRPAAPPPAPWATEPRSVDLPPSFYEPPMLAEGVAFFETRNLAILGEEIERRILADYPREARYPVTLKDPEVLGYPIDVLSQGIEGRVLVWFGVDEEGKVVDRASLDGPPELVAWVLPRLDRLVDKPAHDELVPRRGWVAMEIVFSREAAEEARSMRDAAEERLMRAEELAKAREAAK